MDDRTEQVVTCMSETRHIYAYTYLYILGCDKEHVQHLSEVEQGVKVL